MTLLMMRLHPIDVCIYVCICMSNKEMFWMTRSPCTCSFASHDFIKMWNFLKILLLETSGELKV